MTTLQVHAVRDTARPMAARLAARAANPIGGLNVAGRALSNLLKAHYRQKAQTPNKLGGERSFFWLAVGRGVNAPTQSGPATVQVSISHPAINQKIFGGTITAKRAKALTIPLVPVAYGRSAAVLSRLLGIRLFRVKNVLAGWDESLKKLTAYYALKRSVTQAADPTALPPSGDIERTVNDAFVKWIERAPAGGE